MLFFYFIFFYLGIQYAGGHLRELQKAFKNPTAHLGLIIGEVKKRGLKSIGLSTPPSLNHVVHPNLSDSGALCSKVQKQLYSISAYF